MYVRRTVVGVCGVFSSDVCRFLGVEVKISSNVSRNLIFEVYA